MVYSESDMPWSKKPDPRLHVDGAHMKGGDAGGKEGAQSVRVEIVSRELT